MAGGNRVLDHKDIMSTDVLVVNSPALCLWVPASAGTTGATYPGIGTGCLSGTECAHAVVRCNLSGARAWRV